MEAAATEAVLTEPAADGDPLPAKTEEPPGLGTGEINVRRADFESGFLKAL